VGEMPVCAAVVSDPSFFSLCVCVPKVLHRCLGAWVRARTCQWLANQRRYREGRDTHITIDCSNRCILTYTDKCSNHASILRSTMYSDWPQLTFCIRYLCLSCRAEWPAGLAAVCVLTSAAGGGTTPRGNGHTHTAAGAWDR
jgi:hypothetical protein